MLALLRAGDFDGAFAAVGRLQQLHHPHPSLPSDSDERFARLMVFEREISTICSAEDAHGAVAVLQRGHGVVRPRCGCRLMRIAFSTAAPVCAETAVSAAADAIFASPTTSFLDVMVSDALSSGDADVAGVC